MLRQMRYLRISVTCLCNQSCYFCHHEGDPVRRDELTVDDIVFVCGIAQRLKFDKHKLTGGEPTLRKDICDLIERLAALGLSDLSMITNGTTLETLATPLRRAGLKRLNVTLNTLNETKYREINHSHHVPLSNILRGIDAAIGAGFTDMKVNFVYTGNDDDLTDILHFTAQRGLTLVLLPLLPGKTGARGYDLHTLRGIIDQMGVMHEVTDVDTEGIERTRLTLESGAAVLLRKSELADCQPYVFCPTCPEHNFCKEGIFPLRLSANGTLIPCLACSDRHIALKDAIQQRDEETVAAALNRVRGWQTYE